MKRSSQSSDFYVYIYHDPERGVPIYVGKGCGDRALKHLKRQATNKQFRNRLATLKRKGLDPHVEIIACDDEPLSFSEEVRLIAAFGRRDKMAGTLYNATDGGEGSSGRVVSADTRRKISEANKNPTVESRAKMSAWLRSEETKLKIGEKVKAARANWSTDMIEAERFRRSKSGLKPETRSKMSASAKARPPLQCPHCGKIGKSPGIRRHHFEFCKLASPPVA